MGNSVLLRQEGKLVGIAKLFTAGSSEPKRVLHDIPLSNFAREDENLVVVYHVQIFKEYINLQYPYSYGGSEAPPSALGDLNVLGKHFKDLIAWDCNKLVHHDVESDLLDQPRTVSEKILNDAGGEHASDADISGKRVRWDDGIERTSGSMPFENTASNRLCLDEEPHLNGGTRKKFSRSHTRRNLYNGCVPRSARRSGEAFFSNDINCSDSIDRIELYTINKVLENEPQTKGSEKDGNAAGKNYSGSCSEVERVDSPRHNQDQAACDSSNDDGVDNSVEEHGGQLLDVDDESLLDGCVEAENCVKRLPFPRKRAYVYHTRKRGSPQGPRDIRKRRKVLFERLDNPFLRSRLRCCKKLKCFETINPIYAFKTYKQVMGMNREDFKSFLISLYHPGEHCFMLKGHRVCARYLQRGFGFSNDLQCSVKSTPGAPAGPTASVLPRLKLSKKKDSIINFLVDYADACGDMMPNVMFTNLPEVRRKDVYEKLKQHYRTHIPAEEPSSLNFFYAVWKFHCKNVRTRRNHGFARCETCIYLKDEISQNQRNQGIVRRAREMLTQHLEMVREERRLYRHRCERARIRPKKYMSIVVDGADQTAYGLPHFLEKSKSDRGHKIKVKCVGSLQHASVNQLRLFIMTDELLTGANHIIEVVHRTLSEHKVEAGRMSEVLYIQVDNCTRENKNRYLMCYCEMLVSLGVFVEVEVSFLPIGQTHTDIDQAFSAVGNVLKHSDAEILPELLRVMGSCYNSKTSAVRMDKVVNFSALCEESRSVVRSHALRGFTENRYFRFSRALGSTTDGEGFRTQCHVKVQARDEWELLSLEAVKGFLISVPDLRNAPDTETFPPGDVTEINKCLSSLHSRTRINAPRIIASLSVLRDEIYTKRFEYMHWDLEDCFELNGDFTTNLFNEEENISGGEEQPESIDGLAIEDTLAHGYDVESFVAVKPESGTSGRFWIAMILEVADRSSSNRPRWLRVMWYSQKPGAEDEFNSRYIPSKVYNSHIRRHIPYEDQIDVATVFLQFPSLNSQGYLRANTRKALRQALGLN